MHVNIKVLGRIFPVNVVAMKEDEKEIVYYLDDDEKLRLNEIVDILPKEKCSLYEEDRFWNLYRFECHIDGVIYRYGRNKDTGDVEYFGIIADDKTIWLIF